MKVEDGSLRIRSQLECESLLRQPRRSLSQDAEGFVDTGDMLELRGTAITSSAGEMESSTSAA